MFTDYYQLLGIPEIATLDEIKSAYRQQAKKWHPDKNPGLDTTEKMQRLTEAYLVLKDVEARMRYDIELMNFRLFTKRKEFARWQAAGDAFTQENEESEAWVEYDLQDELLKRWVANAKRQAVDLAKRTIDDMRGMVTVAAKEGSYAMVLQIFGIVIVAVFSMVWIFFDKVIPDTPETIPPLNKWYDNSIHWFYIRTPSKFMRVAVDEYWGAPEQSNSIKEIENYAFTSAGLIGTFSFMETDFAAYIPEVGLKKGIESLMNVKQGDGLTLEFLTTDDTYDDAACRGYVTINKDIRFLSGYCVWSENKVFMVTVVSDTTALHRQAVENIMKSIRVKTWK